LLAGRLTAHLKGSWPGTRAGQIENTLPYCLHGEDETDKSSKNDADRKIRVSCHAAKSLKQIQQTQQLTDAKLEVCKFSWRTLNYRAGWLNV
jgi:hypothetical protein